MKPCLSSSSQTHLKGAQIPTGLLVMLGEVAATPVLQHPSY